MLTINPDVLSKYPGMAVGVITVTNADNTGTHPEVTALLREAEEGIRTKMDLETFKEHPNIAAMQEVHRSFGNNPNKYPPSMQALCKRIIKGGELPIINPIVDIYNIFSLRHVICVGAEDTDKCEGDLRLAYADGTEEFALIGSDENDPPADGELVYKDDAGVICRKLNWREGDRTQIDENTKNCVIVVEGFAPFAREELESVLQEIAWMVGEYCSAETLIEILEG